MTGTPTLLRHLKAALPGPVVVALVIPGLLLATIDSRIALPSPVALATTAGGVVLIAAGLWMEIRSIVLFDRIGRGTLSPLNPTSTLVVSGPYRHVRNPMFSAVLAILLGEAAVTQSLAVLIWFAVFWASVMITIPLVEEPRLARRFGDDYDRYRRHVPRWIPRVRPWQPTS